MLFDDKVHKGEIQIRRIEKYDKEIRKKTCR